MDIKIMNIQCNWRIEDLYIEHARQRIFQLGGYTVEYYFNKYIKTTIEIPSSKELTIDEIKEKIKEIYRSV